uniref:Uncharacterized protein n=1 Tax=Avena sativa TaxID=4498 RepID=A0ACD6AKF3_AVESA
MSCLDPTWRWRVTYTTSKDLDRGRQKHYDGEIHLCPKHNWLALINAKGGGLIGKKISLNDLPRIGSILPFTGFKVTVLSCILCPELCGLSPDFDLIDPIIDPIILASSLNLDLSSGLAFKNEVKRKFRSTVHPLGKAHHFLMVVSFGRSKFKPDDKSVALALESCIGGVAQDLSVLKLADRVFRFSVSSKYVGFLVYGLQQYSCRDFKCFFHLWSNGGPLWNKKFNAWQKECNEEWTLISPNKKRTDCALRALKKKPGRSCFRKVYSGSKKLSFAAFEKYDACEGYECPISKDQADVYLEAGYDCPQLRRRAGAILPPSVSVVTQNIQFGTFSEETQPSHGKDSNSKVQNEEDPDFGKIIDDMVYRVFKCRKCLSMGHVTNQCSNQIRCRACFHYGHIKKECLKLKSQARKRWIPKGKRQFGQNVS